jgi:glycine/D-amino acid oxidase-like deaminating enzyme
MRKKYSNNFTIIGLGMVGTAIGYLLKKAGYEIVAVFDKSS